MTPALPELPDNIRCREPGCTASFTPPPGPPDHSPWVCAEHKHLYKYDGRGFLRRIEAVRAQAELPEGLPPLPEGALYAGILRDFEGPLDGWVYTPDDSLGWGRGGRLKGMRDNPESECADWHFAAVIPFDDAEAVRASDVAPEPAPAETPQFTARQLIKAAVTMGECGPLEEGDIDYLAMLFDGEIKEVRQRAEAAERDKAAAQADYDVTEKENTQLRSILGRIGELVAGPVFDAQDVSADFLERLVVTVKNRLEAAERRAGDVSNAARKFLATWSWMDGPEGWRESCNAFEEALAAKEEPK